MTIFEVHPIIKPNENTKENVKMQHMYLRHYGRVVDVFAVAPTVQTFLLLKFCDVDVFARQETLVREIPDHVQAVSAASAQLVLPIHHLSATTTITFNEFLLPFEVFEGIITVLLQHNIKYIML